MFISSVQTFSGVGKKNRELFAESEVLRIPHNANKKAHGSTASVSAFVSIVAGNHLVFGLLEMQKRFYIIYLSSIQLFRYIVFLVVISFAKIHHILQMTNFFFRTLIKWRRNNKVKQWQLLRARFSETLTIWHTTAPHCVRVVESNALRVVIVTTYFLTITKNYANWMWTTSELPN